MWLSFLAEGFRWGDLLAGDRPFCCVYPLKVSFLEWRGGSKARISPGRIGLAGRDLLSVAGRRAHDLQQSDLIAAVSELQEQRDLIADLAALSLRSWLDREVGLN
ncbi:MAG: hypothetical protein AAF327_14020 [Cyanobacteria bacterium P01_A01_bin.37]